VPFFKLFKDVTFVFQNKDPHSSRIIINNGKKIGSSPWVRVLEGPQRSECTYSKGLLELCMPLPTSNYPNHVNYYGFLGRRPWNGTQFLCTISEIIDNTHVYLTQRIFKFCHGNTQGINELKYMEKKKKYWVDDRKCRELKSA